MKQNLRHFILISFVYSIKSIYSDCTKAMFFSRLNFFHCSFNAPLLKFFTWFHWNWINRTFSVIEYFNAHFSTTETSNTLSSKKIYSKKRNGRFINRKRKQLCMQKVYWHCFSIFSLLNRLHLLLEFVAF